MKTAALVFLTFMYISIYSQTKRIYHKSHSGKSVTYHVFGNDNFGLPNTKLDSVLKISDKKIVTYESYPYKNAKAIIDTLKEHYHFTNAMITLDSLEKMYPGVKFLGFNATWKTGKEKRIVKKSKK